MTIKNKDKIKRQYKNKYAYMCETDFLYELGEAQGGVTLYANVEDLQERKSCVGPKGGCGIVKVRINVEEVIIPTDWSREDESNSN